MSDQFDTDFTKIVQLEAEIERLEAKEKELELALSTAIGNKEQAELVATAAHQNTYAQGLKEVAEAYETIERLRGALEKLARFGNSDQLGNSDGSMIARQALKENASSRSSLSSEVNPDAP
jgi:hypothetical protein